MWGGFRAHCGGGMGWSQEPPENSARQWLTVLGLTIAFGDCACHVMSVTGVYGAIGTCRDSPSTPKGQVSAQLGI